MIVYQATFDRANFYFEPPLKQSLDIVFQVKSENPSDIVLERIAFKGLEKQHPSFFDYDFNIEDVSGFSTVMMRGNVQRVEIEDISVEDLGVPGEGTPRIGETFSITHSDRISNYRVSGFYKEIVYEETGNAVHDLIMERLIAKSIEANKGTIVITECYPEEAEFISGSGIAGGIYPISMVNPDGLVGWSPRIIKKARDEYKVNEHCSPIRIKTI